VGSDADTDTLDDLRRLTGDPRGEAFGDERGDFVLTRSRMQYGVQLSATKLINNLILSFYVKVIN